MARGKSGNVGCRPKKRTVKAKLRKTEANRRVCVNAVEEILNKLLEKVVSFEANVICSQLLQETVFAATESAEQRSINLQPLEEYDL